MNAPEMRKPASAEYTGKQDAARIAVGSPRVVSVKLIVCVRVMFAF